MGGVVFPDSLESNLLSFYMSEKLLHLDTRRRMRMFSAGLFVMAENWEQPTWLFTDSSMDKQSAVHPYNGLNPVRQETEFTRARGIDLCESQRCGESRAVSVTL